MDSIQITQPCTVISRGQFTMNHGVPRSFGTLLVDLTTKPPSGFKPVNPGLVIGKYLIDSLLFYYNKTM